MEIRLCLHLFIFPFLQVVCKFISSDSSQSTRIMGFE